MTLRKQRSIGKTEVLPVQDNYPKKQFVEKLIKDMLNSHADELNQMLVTAHQSKQVTVSERDLKTLMIMSKNISDKLLMTSLKLISKYYK